MYNLELGVKYIPGNGGKDCPSNGEHKDAFGNIIECQCDECDYYLCCIDENFEKHCTKCCEFECKNNKTERKWPFI